MIIANIKAKAIESSIASVDTSKIINDFREKHLVKY